MNATCHVHRAKGLGGLFLSAILLVTVTSVASGQERLRLPGHLEWRPGLRPGERLPATVLALVFTPDGKTLISSGMKDVKVWNVANGRLRRTIPRNFPFLGRVIFQLPGRFSQPQ